MPKTMIINLENVNGVERDMTAEEQTLHNEIVTSEEARITAQAEAKEANDNLKASAKAKLMAGEALTEEEANVMIGG